MGPFEAPRRSSNLPDIIPSRYSATPQTPHLIPQMSCRTYSSLTLCIAHILSSNQLEKCPTQVKIFTLTGAGGHVVLLPAIHIHSPKLEVVQGAEVEGEDEVAAEEAPGVGIWNPRVRVAKAVGPETRKLVRIVSDDMSEPLTTSVPLNNSERPASAPVPSGSNATLRATLTDLVIGFLPLHRLFAVDKPPPRSPLPYIIPDTMAGYGVAVKAVYEDIVCQRTATHS
ncbi:hypothetical protein L198_07235 [Cryptococcus wingfieldii CBS 7118]|uniref:Uncharacterized protein n=1 Tax=Cryptococcus wingfieldii CBS 7118 TaxID=1295528 RepID=A0A1E3IFL6_9TREE|nr:hypothetical protein L198_07235 [Cryptococcus wingfieldii CBS 7118]ODN86541.1 hypothetical protein L198_07235 [Cryptococcus wingfieldii CBS 7118]